MTTVQEQDDRHADAIKVAGSDGHRCEGCRATDREVQHSDEIGSTLCAQCFADHADRLHREVFEPLRELTELLTLDDVGLEVTGCRIVGVGRDASGDIFLSNGRSIVFGRLTEALNARSLMGQVVATVGAEPKLKDQDARHVVALMRRAGKVEESITEDVIATQWGRDFIEEADVLDVNVDDQGERWSAFKHLRDRDPAGLMRDRGGSFARGCVVLRHIDGSLYVRTSWFRHYVRQVGDHLLSPGALATRMQRVGWVRPGKEGRVKATRPDLPGHDLQAFYIVPPEWDERRSDGSPERSPGTSIHETDPRPQPRGDVR
jgi:hypothetical protein